MPHVNVKAKCHSEDQWSCHPEEENGDDFMQLAPPDIFDFPLSLFVHLLVKVFFPGIGLNKSDLVEQFYRHLHSVIPSLEHLLVGLESKFVVDMYQDG